MISFADAAYGGNPWKVAGMYLPAQVGGCVSGALLANVMFGRAAVSLSTHHRYPAPTS